MDPDGCISSTGYQDIGGQYPDNDACTIAVASDNMQAIDVVAFSTEAGKDRLLVNGVAYDGSTGPVDIVPTADITWSSDAQPQHEVYADSPSRVCTSASYTRSTQGRWCHRFWLEDLP